MRIHVLSLFLAAATVGASSAAIASPAVRAARPASIQPASLPEQAALLVARAAFAGDRATVVALTLTYSEVLAISQRADRDGDKEWNEEIDRFVERSASDARDFKLSVVDAKVVKSGTLRSAPGTRLRRDVDYAIVQLSVARPGAEPGPRKRTLIFVRTDGGWRFSPRP